MSRFKSPQVAARRAERAAKEARKSRLMLIGIALLMVASTTAYFVFYALPRWNNPPRHQHHQHVRRTNAPAPATSPLMPQTTQTNHE